MSKSLTEIGREFVAHSGMNASSDLEFRTHPPISPRHLLERAQHELLEAYGQAEKLLTPAYQDEQAVVNGYVSECADIVLTLVAGLAAQGFDLQAEVERKHAVNMKRTWEPHPSIPGAVKRRK